MALLIVGLLLFFGTHALTIMRDTRAGLISWLGAGGYKSVYSLGSFAGLGLIVWGFVRYRAGGYMPIWTPPAAMNHITMALMLPAMIMLFVYLLPAGRMKSVLKHPMLVMLKIWAFAHLLVNGDLGSMLLFGSFLAYAVIVRISLKRRPGVASVPNVGWNMNDWMAVGLGVVTYFAFVYYLHAILFGVPVLAGR